MRTDSIVGGALAFLTLTLGVNGAYARAVERSLFVDLDTVAGAEPTRLCVLARFVRLEGEMDRRAPTEEACAWSEGTAGRCSFENLGKDLESRGICATRYPAPDILQRNQLELWCEGETAPRNGHGAGGSQAAEVQAARVMIIQIDDAGVIGARFEKTQVSLTIQTQIGATKTSLVVRNAGGDYLTTTATAHRDRDGSDRARLALVPNCQHAHLLIPRYECAGDRQPKLIVSSQDRSFEIDVDGLLPSELDLPLPRLTERGDGRLVLEDCHGDLRLDAAWREQPPPILSLQPKTFALQWHSDPLSPKECPELHLPEVGLSCPPGGPERTSDGLCTYHCLSSVPVALPTVAAFTSKDAAHNHWEIAVERPGDLLEGYLPADARYVMLRRQGSTEIWNRFGDQVRWIEITTPDGRTQQIAPEVDRLAVPGLQKGDSVTYRYIGDRQFVRKTTTVEAGGTVTLPAPQDVLAWEAIQPGVAAWGGARFINAAEDSTRWSPVGGVELIVAIPAWRYQPLRGRFYVEPEIHIGLGLTRQPYESIFRATDADPLPKTTWTNVLIGIVPIEATARTTWAPFALNLGGGLMPVWEFWAADKLRVASSLALSVRFDASWRISQVTSLGLGLRYLFGRESWFGDRAAIESFDIGGARERRQMAASTLMFGPTLRFDDVF